MAMKLWRATVQGTRACWRQWLGRLRQPRLSSKNHRWIKNVFHLTERLLKYKYEMKCENLFLIMFKVLYDFKGFGNILLQFFY